MGSARRTRGARTRSAQVSRPDGAAVEGDGRAGATAARTDRRPPHGARRSARGDAIAAARRLRQCDQPAVVTGRRPSPRDRGARRARRHARADRATAAHESVMLATTGTLIGVALAPAMLGTMRALMPLQLSGLAPAAVDLRVLTFAAGLALVTGIGFGLWPALGSTREAPAETIKAGGRAATGRGAGRARRALMGVELALTVVLLVGSLLMLSSFERLMSLDRGMQTERVGTLEMAFGSSAGDRA